MVKGTTKKIGDRRLVIGTQEWAAFQVKTLKGDIVLADRDASNLARHVREAHNGEIWNLVFADEPKTWERFCDEKLNTPNDFIDLIVKGVEKLRASGNKGKIPAREAINSIQSDLAAGHDLIRPRGNQPKSSNTRFGDSDGSNPDAEYWARRLARDEPEHYQKWVNGEYRSVNQAVTVSGIKPKRITIALSPVLAANQIKKHFTQGQIRELIAELTNDH